METVLTRVGNVQITMTQEEYKELAERAEYEEKNSKAKDDLILFLRTTSAGHATPPPIIVNNTGTTTGRTSGGTSDTCAYTTALTDDPVRENERARQIAGSYANDMAMQARSVEAHNKRQSDVLDVYKRQQAEAKAMADRAALAAPMITTLTTEVVEANNEPAWGMKKWWRK